MRWFRPSWQYCAGTSDGLLSITGVCFASRSSFRCRRGSSSLSPLGGLSFCGWRLGFIPACLIPSCASLGSFVGLIDSCQSFSPDTLPKRRYTRSALERLEANLYQIISVLSIEY